MKGGNGGFALVGPIREGGKGVSQGAEGLNSELLGVSGCGTILGNPWRFPHCSVDGIFTLHVVLLCAWSAWLRGGGSPCSVIQNSAGEWSIHWDKDFPLRLGAERGRREFLFTNDCRRLKNNSSSGRLGFGGAFSPLRWDSLSGCLLY